MCRDVQPRHLLVGQSLSEDDSPEARARDKAMVSQAVGLQLDFDDTELFLVAKSAILQSVSRSGYDQIVQIKQRLLAQGPSQKLEVTLIHYYKAVYRFLEHKESDPELAEIVDQSKFIYLDRRIRHLDSRALALGVTDAFLTLKEAGLMTIDALDILPRRLQKVLPSQSKSAYCGNREAAA